MTSPSHASNSEPEVLPGDDQVIAVTMTRGAARRFKAALYAGTAVLMPSYEPPLTERERERAAHADWLRWGASRVTNAEEE
jgi:hypothetical protein